MIDRFARTFHLFSVLLVLSFTFPVIGHADDVQYPLAVAVAQNGTVFIADSDLPGVWKITGGKMEIYFQASRKNRTPLNAVRCLSIDKEGRLLAGDSGMREVYRFDEIGKPQPLTDGNIDIPVGIAVDSQGNLFVSDLGNSSIWKVSAGGGKPSKFVEIRVPRGITVDARDQLWVISQNEDQLVKVSPAGKIETVVKGKTFEFPHAVAVDKNGSPYVVDGYARTIWKIDASGKPVKFAQGAEFVNPVDVKWQGDKLLVADSGAKAIFEVDLQGKVTRFNYRAAK